MKRILLSFAAAAALAVTAFGTASAQVIPPGSYQQSCTNIHVRGDQLIANCNAPRGGTMRTSMTLGSCRHGDIANMNGSLTCNSNGYNGGYRNGNNGYGNNGYGNNGNRGYGNNGNGYGNNGYGMSGSYQQSCSNARMRNGMLTATCPTANGQQITTSIDPRSCRGADIANINGRLQCH